uniref:Uncharacterized protein n=1 Tax=Strigamia maritima TaxID=126957 RepID=T1JDE3_STRMM
MIVNAYYVITAFMVIAWLHSNVLVILDGKESFAKLRCAQKGAFMGHVFRQVTANVQLVTMAYSAMYYLEYL